ncbi:SHOCT domain-containing protein [Symbiobacterium terraclitae]|uniref:SHOCT domain-containing protein n=1 Tax=Symbiobacterium terraclitae TaxID=557451 RepID=UPI0035B510A7
MTVTGVVWPTWVARLIPIAILLNLVICAIIWARVNALFHRLAERAPYRNRSELEEAFRSGAVSREEYERLKARLS